ncbi:unnamed protein product [Aureobasidium uvarum]|uniref:Uncharacterized protein n=1 Tax=Aureobasidium uvarum TaxID=2773716 RepID=A0A9N8PU71_9PEZI|nr:unnamed protein product [Aureobasidium uvarum]
MDNPPEPMPKVSVDPLPPAASPSPSSPPSPPLSPPPQEHIVVTSHEGSVVAVPAADPTLQKAVLPPPSDPKPPSPPPAPPVVVAITEPVPPPASPVVSPAPVIVEKVKESPSAVSVPTPVPAPAPSPAPASAPASPTTIVVEKKKSDKVPVLIATRSAPELQQDSHELQARPSVLSFRSAPPDTFVRRDTHVVVIDPAVNEQPKRHWRDKVRKFWVSKLGVVETVAMSQLDVGMEVKQILSAREVNV